MEVEKMDTNNFKPVNYQLDHLTTIGVGDGNKFLEVLSGLKDVLDITYVNNALSTSYNQFKQKAIIRPYEGNEGNWMIHISWGSFTDKQLEKMLEEDDFDGLCEMIEYGKKHHKFRIETNPSRTKNGGAEQYWDTLKLIGNFVKATHNSRIDIAMDYRKCGLLNSNIIDRVPYNREYIPHFNRVGGEIESKYLGKRTSSYQIVVYNKSLEQKNKQVGDNLHKDTIEDGIERAEVRINNKRSCDRFMLESYNPYIDVDFISNSQIDWEAIKLGNKKSINNIRVFHSLLNSSENNEDLIRDMFSKNTITKYKKILRENTMLDKVIDPYADFEKVKGELQKEVHQFNSILAGTLLDI